MVNQNTFSADIMSTILMGWQQLCDDKQFNWSTEMQKTSNCQHFNITIEKCRSCMWVVTNCVYICWHPSTLPPPPLLPLSQSEEDTYDCPTVPSRWQLRRLGSRRTHHRVVLHLCHAPFTVSSHKNHCYSLETTICATVMFYLCSKSADPI